MCQNIDCFLSGFSSHEKMRTVGILLHILIRKKKQKHEGGCCFLALHEICSIFYTLKNYESVNIFQEKNSNIEIFPRFCF